MCFDCLQRRIQADFSDKLIFSYGLSDSAFPFGSSAVVQLSDSCVEDSAQFVLVYIPSYRHDCLTRYVDEFVLEDLGGNNNSVSDSTTLAEKNKDQAEVDDGISAETTSASLLNESRYLLNGGRKTSMAGLGSSNSACDCSARFSCLRTITALAPIAQIAICSYSIFEELASNFFSGSVEDQLLHSLCLFIEGKATGRDSLNFLSLVGIPLFNDNSLPGCLRHPNIAPVLGMLKTSGFISLVLPKTPYTLENMLHYSPDAMKSEWHIRFLIYQLLSALAYIHGLGVAHGNICPSNVLLSTSCWSWLHMCDKFQLRSNLNPSKEFPINSSSKINCCIGDCSSHGLYADLKLSSSMDWHSGFNRWWSGELSNFEYLLILNRLAGRRWGDHTFHTVMPWVIDFSVKPDENSDYGWRDLSKSKWRLAKGDEQLDFTYSTSEIPHHVSDECLSELAVCSYKARRLPLSVLRLAVRSVYEPNEYPSTMQRLYQWTPDECIPEFYCNPQVFFSLHSGMTDLAVPSWAGGPEEFIKMHRDALESNRVSSQIHHWIDITFGYKMSGQAAVTAKNVMLPSSDPTMPRSVGRRQLFSRPHPIRRGATRKNNTDRSGIQQRQVNEVCEKFFLETDYLRELEEADVFVEHAWILSPLYSYRTENHVGDISPADDPPSESLKESIFESPDSGRNYEVPSDIDLNHLLEYIGVDDDGSMGYQELLLWRQKSYCSRTLFKNVAEDIFSVGCILAELYLRRPLFNSTSITEYLEKDILPELMQELPFHAKVIVEACIRKDWRRRPSAKSLLESPYFPATIRSSYLFLAPLQLLAKDGSRLCYTANFAKQGALKEMGTFAAEMCAPYCLPFVANPLSDTEAEWAYIMLKEFLKCLKPKAVKALILPAIQKILQATNYSHLKVLLLQDSFVREVWNKIGKQAYLATLHPSIMSNLYIAPHKSSAAAASVLLIVSSEELGIPITINQTVLPLIHCFGKGLCTDGIDVLVRIGGLLGGNFIVTQILPLLKNVVRSCIDVSLLNKPEPVQSWSVLALIDCLVTLDGLITFLPREAVVKELIEDGNCMHVTVLMHTNLDIPVLQVAATTLISVCERIGPDLTALHVLPQLKELFDELAFSQDTAYGSGSSGRILKISKPKVDEYRIESRMDLVLLLYPSFASLLGIEKLRQCCATWLLLEQFLLRCHNWKWEYTGDSPRNGVDNISSKRPMFTRSSTSEYNPAKLLLNGVGWSIPQSQGTRGGKNLILHKKYNDTHQNPVERHIAATNLGEREPWFWFPTPAASWSGLDSLGRVGGLKEELPWKIRASVLYSVRAHHGAVRTLAICRDECTVFTAGVGPGFKGTVQRWDLARTDCVAGYYGHEEVVNDICVLSSSGRVASCDGTIHVWNSKTGKLLSVFAEQSPDSAHLSSPSSSPSRINIDPANMLNSASLSSGILSSAFDGSLYTCMHLLESDEKIVVGTGNGSLRFIDIVHGQKLHLWRSEFFESSFPSLISALCSCGSDKMQADGAAGFPSWIAAGLSSGNCKMLDARSGNVIASWRAHDGYVTKLAAPEGHLLVSSSLDRTLRIWDLRKNWPCHRSVLRGHSDGVSGFSVWGQDVISISKNKIGLSSLTRPADEDGQRVTPQNLYMADRGTKNLSVLSSISILPFSRLFLVGTEDGYLRICC